MERHESLLAWWGAGSLLLFLGSLVAIPIIVVRMPDDFFVRPGGALPRHPIRQCRRVAKNVLGYLLILAGIAMLVLPGQGLLTLAVGLSLIDFPGKRRLELRLVRLRGVHASIDWMRRRSHRPPLQVSDPD